ncbi:cholesterol esterase [Streptomyces halstedii]|uniref:Cholesterol esterase n=2 Tax=Streptomyces halstedii TaxID=1944 RepID=A0ABS6TRY7_STRHA|nr:cholesterol esterase [Streptomyces halstedii]
MVPSVAATAAVGIGLAQGALAASFSVSGQEFKVKATELEGWDFVQYGSVASGKTLEGKDMHASVAVSGFSKANITNMCQSVVTPKVPGIGTVTLRLEAGGGGTPVKAKSLYLDVSELDADAEFKNIDIGVAAGSLPKSEGKPGIQPNTQANPYGFSQRAEKALLKNVKQKAWATTAGTFNLSGLKLRLSTGTDQECY